MRLRQELAPLLFKIIKPRPIKYDESKDPDSIDVSIEDIGNTMRAIQRNVLPSLKSMMEKFPHALIYARERRNARLVIDRSHPGLAYLTVAMVVIPQVGRLEVRVDIRSKWVALVMQIRRMEDCLMQTTMDKFPFLTLNQLNAFTNVSYYKKTTTHYQLVGPCCTSPSSSVTSTEDEATTIFSLSGISSIVDLTQS